MHKKDFPVKFSFNCENANYHKILVSDQILIKLQYGGDK